MTKNLLLVSLVGFCFQGWAQDPNHPLTLHSAVEMARSSNPSVRSSQEKVKQTDQDVPLARALLMPNVSLTANQSENQDAANQAFRQQDNTYNQYKSDLGLVQPLFVYGSFSAIDSARKGRDINRLNVEITSRDLTNNVIQGYYKVILNNLNVDTLVRQRQILGETVATAERREKTGRGQLLDVLQVKSQVAALDSQIADAKNQVQVAAANLANLLGDTQAQEFHVSHTSLNAPILDEVDQHVDLKRSRLPELEVNRLSIEQIDDQKSIQLGQNLPTLKATADYMYNSTMKSTFIDGDSQSWQVGLMLTVPIFSGLSMHYQQEKLNATKSQLEFDRVYTQNLLTLQQVTNRKQLESARQSIVFGEEALRLAIASSNEAKRNYRLATIDFLQFLQVEQAYVQAEQSLNLLKYNYIVALGSYYVASGQELDGLVALLEPGR